ncbi:hypothetical protein MSG28_015128 [Choristoneura fumiferana]|uniref:Uncharacterized protein n=1 Tax=Choristoneura fumiferana TaxID=7141 RepID=A0ACC0KZB1_CHOFU|nr:hypothetical protein MSG28_015128 [Choristoneura fumiferana]
MFTILLVVVEDISSEAYLMRAPSGASSITSQSAELTHAQSAAARRVDNNTRHNILTNLTNTSHYKYETLWQEQETPEYDIDSEDERWLKQQRHPELTELMFEQMMDKLEKSSGQTVVTLNEAKLLLERHDDLVIAVYDYWLNKRLKTQHPLILSVKTESRPGQSSNNPYLAFRRRTEKMQTRKNRKNDESSYEKMLKLRRDLARALSLLELVARREKAKRELLKLTAVIAERRYRAGDYAEPQPRPQYPVVSLATPCFRRDAYAVQHYPPRAPPTPVDQPRPVRAFINHSTVRVMRGKNVLTRDGNTDTTLPAPRWLCEVSRAARPVRGTVKDDT